MVRDALRAISLYSTMRNFVQSVFCTQPRNYMETATRLRVAFYFVQ